MKAEVQTETTVTEKVVVELSKAEAFAVWEIAMYLAKDSDWHLTNNITNSYKVETTEWAKDFFSGLEKALDPVITGGTGAPDILRTYRS